jgi:hypothetical protein
LTLPESVALVAPMPLAPVVTATGADDGVLVAVASLELAAAVTTAA